MQDAQEKMNSASEVTNAAETAEVVADDNAGKQPESEVASTSSGEPSASPTDEKKSTADGAPIEYNNPALYQQATELDLTFRQRKGVKKQSYFNQISRTPLSSVELKEVESNKGVKIDD